MLYGAFPVTGDNDEMPSRILHQIIQEEEEEEINKKELEEPERRQKEANYFA